MRVPKNKHPILNKTTTFFTNNQHRKGPRFFRVILRLQNHRRVVSQPIRMENCLRILATIIVNEVDPQRKVLFAFRITQIIDENNTGDTVKKYRRGLSMNG